MASAADLRTYLSCVKEFAQEDLDVARRSAEELGRDIAHQGQAPHFLEEMHALAIRELSKNGVAPSNEEIEAARRVFAQALFAYAEVVQLQNGPIFPIGAPDGAWLGLHPEESQERLRLALAASGLASWRWDLQSKRFEGDERFLTLFGWNFDPKEQLRTDEDFLAAVHPQDLGKVVEAIFKLLAHNAPFDLEYRLLANGQTLHVSSRAIVKRNNAGVAEQMFGVSLDITERKALIADFELISHMDPLTGVLNRRGLDRAMVTESQRRKRHGGEMHALFLDLDDFKRLNDVYGTATGDAVLITVARLLTDCVRVTDHIARVNSDDFLVILPNTRRAEARMVAMKIHEALRQAVVTERYPQLRINASGGLVSAGLESESTSDLLIRVERSLARAKRLGKGQVWVDNALFQSEAAASVSWEQLAREISDPTTYFSVKQPIMDLRTDALYGYEVLARNVSSTLANPEDFLNFAMDAGLARQVDLNAYSACSALCNEIPSELSCHLNILPSTLMSTPIAELMAKLPPKGSRRRFCIEISEKETIGDAGKMLKYVDEMRAAGVRVAMDDIGFGRSCLEALIMLEPEVVKIDRIMVDKFSDDLGRRRILERMLRVISTWGAVTVAEGIEREEDLEALREMGVPYGQGYLLGRPA
ncbi:MAG: EAL domain-containing protein [Planctomycetota bacterium]|nr:EAL domain-containing protein [Planctomycetota bacterium]